MLKYITFDNYYTITDYNNFITNLKNNKINFKEFISTKSPYNFYIQIDDKYLPVFLKYNIVPDNTIRYLLEKVQGFYPNEKFYLTRKLSDSPLLFEKYISPKIFQDIKDNEYACVFRYKNKEELYRITRELGIKIWDLGRQREWNLAFTYNKFIHNYIHLNYIILEKTKSGQFSKPGEFELELNYKKLVKVKLDNKFINYPYYDNGIYYALKKTS